jgi:hypothetical protein
MQRPIEKVTDLSSRLQASDFFANFIFFLIALTAELEAAKKALSKEKTARLAVEHSLAEEKATRRSADQSLCVSEEAKDALNQDLLSMQASLTATEEKLSSKSSAFDHAVIRLCEAQIKLEATEEKRKA